MPLNQLLFDHQLAKMTAARSGSTDHLCGQTDLVRGYARRIAEWRTEKGLSNTGWPRDDRPEDGTAPA